MKKLRMMFSLKKRQKKNIETDIFLVSHSYPLLSINNEQTHQPFQDLYFTTRQSERIYLNRDIQLSLIIKRRKDQKKFLAVVAPQKVVFTQQHCRKLMVMTYHVQIYFQVVQIHYLLSSGESKMRKKGLRTCTAKQKSKNCYFLSFRPPDSESWN